MKNVKFLALPVLFVPLIYGLYFIQNACAVPPDAHWGGEIGKQCNGGQNKNGWQITCCWKETTPDSMLVVEYCQTCRSLDGREPWQCEPKIKSISTPQTSGEDSPTGGGGEQPEQPLADENIPRSGSTEQPPPTTSTQQNPAGGTSAQTQGGSTIQLPPQSGSSIGQESGAGASNSRVVPPTNDQAGGGSIIQQPQGQQPQNGQQPESSNEGQSTTSPGN
jgi:hypothetical protein